MKELEAFTHYEHPLRLHAEVVGSGKSMDRLATEASIRFELVPNPVLIELLQKRGFTQRGRGAWSKHLTTENAEPIRGFFRDYMDTFLPTSMSLEEDFKNSLAATKGLGRIDLREDYTTNARPQNVSASINLHTPQMESIRRSIRRVLPQWQPPRQVKYVPRSILDYTRVQAGVRPYQRDTSEWARNWYSLPNEQRSRILDEGKKMNKAGSLVLEVSNGVLWVRFSAVSNLSKNDNLDSIGFPKNKGRQQSNILTPAEAIEVVDALKADWDLDALMLDSQDALSLMSEIEDSIIVGYTPTAPASAILRRGKNVSASRGSALAGIPTETPRKIALKRMLAIQKNNPRKTFYIHPGLQDAVRMTSAKPFRDDDKLRPYQQEAVGIHLATQVGYLQASDPGLGKTIMQIVGMRERAKAKGIQNYRGLIVSEANVRIQWREELEKWWPEAKAFVLDKGDNLNGLVEALSYSGPSVIVISYTQAVLGVLREHEIRVAEQERMRLLRSEERMRELRKKTLPVPTTGSLLLDTHWHDLAADEAIAIRNGSSKQNNAMWILRENADVANALTATPVNKDIDDLGRLIAWVRNDRYLFSKEKLSSLYNANDEASAKKLYKSFGSMIFRRDTSEIAEELPSTNHEVVYLKPSTAEKALATAAERELKRCFLELVAAVEDAEKVDTADKDRAKKVRETLRKANGAWLGGTQLARMSTSDPSALLRSKSVGAALLIGQGLVESAMKTEPTKRTRFISDALKRIQKGQQIVVFTEFTSVATTLVKALNENGIRAKAFTGQNSGTRDRARVAFQSGDVDVLVCTKAAERGLTLHKATTIYHYDTPWTLERIIQRTGRAIRIGSENPTVDIVFMVMEGTVEERVTGQLINQGIASTLVMDYARGADLKKTEAAQALSGLMATASKKSTEKHVIAFGKKLLAI